MLLRFRSREGTFRVEITENENFQYLIDKASEQLNLSSGEIAFSQDPFGKSLIEFPPSAPISDLGLRHGDLLHILINESKKPEAASEPTNKNQVVEDEVDKLLDKFDGLIKRSKDSNFCKHSSNGMCDYCMPLEPYDAGYLEEKGIKHRSFHSHLRQLYPKHKRTASTSEPYSAPIEEECFTVNKNCSGGHAPWPEGICTKCQPSAITLQRQVYRFVDHVEFASALVVDNFIRSWRSTGMQRFGYLIGRFEPYAEVPLGIKAVVEAIYEPPQEDFMDELQVEFTDAAEVELRNVLSLTKLSILGMIYTDLVDKQEGNGKVLCKRHVNSYFLSSQECVFSAAMQSKHPNPCRFSKSGKFGSKFVTCIVTGNQEGDIDISSYQISNSGVAMVEAEIIQPSVQPSSMLVCETSKDLYVPEIFYKFKNEYGVTVQKNASPSFPVEYLIVNVTHGFPSQPEPIFLSAESFPVENRITERGDMSTLKKWFDKSDILEALSDFHLLLFLNNCGILSQEEMDKVVAVATLQRKSDFDRETKLQELSQTPGWMTLMTILQEHQDEPNNPGASSNQGASEPWPCRHCTFVNTGDNSECEMCGLPQG